jgi:formate hydrogenlyase transcriptional activator
VGSTRTTRVDVRVVAATNQDLNQMVRDGEFRQDLYFRLNVFPIYLPPLRGRKADIPELVEYFVQQFAASMYKKIEAIPEETMRAMVGYCWPGNIRELQNYIARGVILANNGVFEPEPLESHQSSELQVARSTLKDRVRKEILVACRLSKRKLGGRQGAAERHGLKRTTLFYKMKRLGIRRPTDAREIESPPPAVSSRAFRVVPVSLARIHRQISFTRLRWAARLSLHFDGMTSAIGLSGILGRDNGRLKG